MRAQHNLEDNSLTQCTCSYKHWSSASTRRLGGMRRCRPL